VNVRKAGTGDKLVNKYLIVKELGKGSFAEVYLCEDVETGEVFQKLLWLQSKQSYRGYMDTHLHLPIIFLYTYGIII
jgi:serine/threonine protein kinase